MVTLDELEGRYESKQQLGPGMRYSLDLEGPRSGLKPGERFTLEVRAYTLTGQASPGTEQPEVKHLGTRRLFGAYRLEGGGVVLDARLITDTPGEAVAIPGPPPTVQRNISETIVVELVAGPALSLHFKLYGSEVLVTRR
ncbi:MAG: hypothetical protein HY553_11955 [Elusimicrobia bacterium]|nr:hypothetical protein [Elusimicrobiota bacterium]